MHFLQSTAWEEFQRALGHTTRRINDVLVIERTTPVGTYWYVGRAELNESTLSELVTAAHKAKALFLRVDPVLKFKIFNSKFSIRPTLSTQPQDSLILNLAPSTDQLLASFHEKTRYNIRVAERHGLVVEESSDPNHRAMTAFLQFARRTADRQAFRYHPDAYYQTMLRVLGEPNDVGMSASVLVAHKDNGPAAAMIVLWTPKTAYYLHGASWYERRKFMAPHLLQWTAIQRAKERGCTAYDFWGIAPPKVKPSGNLKFKSSNFEFDEEHPWAGITRFKLGFGGEVIHFPDSFDVVLNPTVYTLYAMGRRIKRSFG